jgi:hypothetical protein
LSENAPETPPPAEEETPASPPAEEGGGTTDTPGDETPGGGEGGDEPPPVVVLPPPPDYQQGVGTIYGELTDEVNAARWSTQMDNMANAVRVTYDYILPIAYELAGPEAQSRAMARDAVASLLLTRATEEVQGARVAAELADAPEPTPPPAPSEPPSEG